MKLSKASDVGIVVVAGDMPEGRWPDLEAGRVEPIALLFRYRQGGKEDFQIPVRNLLPIEVLMVANRAIMENKIEFWFRPKATPGLVTPGG